jgi:hypothetical protein
MSGPALLLSMSDIARLARVQRPVVTIWRNRSAGSDAPFPRPVTHERGQELFDAADVGSWLTATGRGNNPEAAADAAAHAALDRAVRTGIPAFHSVTALLALRSIIGSPLAPHTRDDLLDSADEHDPDDDLFYREIEQIPAVQLPTLTAYVDALVEAAYSAPAAFERLMADRFKLGLRDLGDTALSTPALRLLAAAVGALAVTQGGDPVLIDVTGGASDAVLAIAQSGTTGRELTVHASRNDSHLARLSRRRLLVHNVPTSTLQPVADDTAGHGRAVYIAQYPTADDQTMTVVDMISAIDDIVMQMSGRQLGVILAPAAVLCDGGLSKEAEELRSAVLRSGRVRAIVRLPAGLVTHRIQQASALWVLGSAHERVELAERWTLVADLTATAITPATIDDLVSDLVASLGDRVTVRAHAFRFARLVFTRTLLARRGSLVAAAPVSDRRHRDGHAAALALRAEELVSAVNTTADAAAHLQLAVTPATPREPAPAAAGGPVTVEQQITARHLRYIPGNRIDPADVIESTVDGDGIRLIGPAEVLGEQPLGGRRIPRLRFAAAYPAGRVTEPGDVVFCTSPRPAAIVDEEGTSVVVFPARILRINPVDPGGLLSDMLAADITAMPPTHRHWRRWPVRQAPHPKGVALADALAAIRAEQRTARLRLAHLDELSALLMDGVAGNAFTVSTTTYPASNITASTNTAPTKGTH